MAEEDAASYHTGCDTINVHRRGVDAHARSIYHMSEVTGVDFDVQAVLISQSVTVELLCEACHVIERHGLGSFTFVCSHATHRSFGCAVLLATLVYHDAKIVLRTRRTQSAALECGMVPALHVA